MRFIACGIGENTAGCFTRFMISVHREQTFRPLEIYRPENLALEYEMFEVVLVHLQRSEARLDASRYDAAFDSVSLLGCNDDYLNSESSQTSSMKGGV